MKEIDQGINPEIATGDKLSPSEKFCCEEVFGLTKEEYDKVTHRTGYNLTPLQFSKTSARMFTLEFIARQWKESGFKIDPNKLHKPVVGDESLFDILCREKIDIDTIMFARSRLILCEEVGK